MTEEVKKKASTDTAAPDASAAQGSQWASQAVEHAGETPVAPVTQASVAPMTGQQAMEIRPSEQVQANTPQATPQTNTREMEKRVNDAHMKSIMNNGFTAGSATPEQIDIRPEAIGADEWKGMSWRDAAKKRPDLTPAQYLSDVAKYRAARGEELPMSEIVSVLQGRDPDMTAKQAKRNERRQVWSERIGAIGNVLANLVNVYRTQNGNPAMQLDSIDKATARAQQIRAYNDAIANGKSRQYLQLLKENRAKKAAAAAQKAEWDHDIYMQKMKDNSPLNILKARVEAAREGTERAKAINEGKRGGLIDAQTADQKEETRLRSGKVASEIERNRASARNSNNSASLNAAKAHNERVNGGSGSGGKDKFITVRGANGRGERTFSEAKDGASWMNDAYEYMRRQSGPITETLAAVERNYRGEANGAPSDQALRSAIAHWNAMGASDEEYESYFGPQASNKTTNTVPNLTKWEHKK